MKTYSKLDNENINSQNKIIIENISELNKYLKAKLMKRKNYDTVTEAMTDLKELGYTIDFSILTDKECLICHLTATELSPDEFEIDHFYRFEGDSDPGDEMIVYAISSKNNDIKGIVVDAYGMYAEDATSEIVKKLNTHPKH